MGPLTMKISVTTISHCTDQEEKQNRGERRAVNKLKEPRPLMGAASNEVRYWLLGKQPNSQLILTGILLGVMLYTVSRLWVVVCMFLISSIGETTHRWIYALLASLSCQIGLVVLFLFSFFTFLLGESVILLTSVKLISSIWLWNEFHSLKKSQKQRQHPM